MLETPYDPLSRGDSSRKWTRRFMDLAAHVAQWSKDPSTKVGAVIVDEHKSVLAMGYNGFPRGVYDTETRLNERTLKYPLTVHAEANAIVAATRSVRGKILVVTMFPCPECTKLLIQAGIETVVCPPPVDREPWREGAAWSSTMLQEAQVCVVHPPEVAP